MFFGEVVDAYVVAKTHCSASNKKLLVFDSNRSVSPILFLLHLFYELARRNFSFD